MSDVESQRVRQLANKIVRLLNSAKHPADALTAECRWSRASRPRRPAALEVWTHRVLVSVENIRRGDIPTKGPGHG